MPELQWAKLDWQALATLVTGVLAVFGAVAVGLRQLAITRRQTAIAARQTHLAELTLRQQLFEKRMRVYEAVVNFLGAIVREGAYPSRDLEIEFLSGLGSSRFLCSERTHAGLQEIWAEAGDFRVWKIKMAGRELKGGDAKREAKFLTWFLARLESLPDLFGEELRLA